MAYQLRRVERYTNWEATEVVNLKPEDFKTLSIPFNGDGEEEFIGYIQSLYEDDWDEICDELKSSDKTAVADALSMLFNGKMKVYSSTTDDEEDSWMEIGDENKEYPKHGYFKSKFSTMNSNKQ